MILLLLIAGLALAQGPGQEELLKQGREIFSDNCAQCHRSNGEGLPGTFPALNKNPFVVGDPQPVIATVLNGRKGKLGQMPAWKDKLSDREIAAAITYIRHAWSNQATAVTPAQVAARRGK
ncbi:MAG: c-type cytochrome [Desulfobaccales bacterium]